MSDLITVQGVVLSSMPVGEYDRRIVLLTRERGKIAAFAKGARRLNSPFMAAAAPFVFGNFTLYEGRSSYNLNHAEILHQFVELSKMQPEVYYGYYFLELADYFGREGSDEKDVMNLLFVAVRSLMNHEIDPRLVRCAYEFRLITIEGMMPAIFEFSDTGERPEKNDQLFFSMSEHRLYKSSSALIPGDSFRISYAALIALQYIASVPLAKLCAFSVTPELLKELESIIYTYTAKNTDRRFKTLEILNMMI